MKFATLPTTDAAPSAVTGKPFVACFPLLGTYGPPPAVADYTPFTLQFTLAKMAEMWWRWKVLTVAFNSDFTGPLTFELTRRNNTAASYFPETSPLFTDERQLIYGTPINGGLPAGAYWDGTLVNSVTPQRDITCQVRMMAGASSVPISAPANVTSYYFEHSAANVATLTPAMEIYLTGFWDDGSEWTILGSTADALQDDNFNVDFDSDGVAMSIATLGGTPQNCSLTIYPTEVFTWAKADGSEPTWDAGTGERV